MFSICLRKKMRLLTFAEPQTLCNSNLRGKLSEPPGCLRPPCQAAPDTVHACPAGGHVGSLVRVRRVRCITGVATLCAVELRCGMAEKQQISVTLDAQLVAALDGMAAKGRTTRSEALEALVGVGIEAREARRKAEQKVTLSVRVSPEVAQQLTAVGTARGTSKNQAAEYVIERGLASLTGEQDTAALTALIQQITDIATSAETRHEKQAHRFAFLLSRMVLETITTRQLMGLFIASQTDIEQAKQMAGTSQTLAVRQLRDAPQSTQEAIREVIAGMVQDG